MESDSVHSTIENNMKGRNINVPQDYIDIIKNARENPFPYKVRFDDLLPHTFFLNYEAHQDIRSIRPGSETSDPTVTDVRQLRYTPDAMPSMTILITYNFIKNRFHLHTKNGNISES